MKGVGNGLLYKYMLSGFQCLFGTLKVRKSRGNYIDYIDRFNERFDSFKCLYSMLLGYSPGIVRLGIVKTNKLVL